MKEIDKPIEIGKDVANVLKELKEVKAIAFYGAIASGFADKYSDIDLICICDRVPLLNTRKNIFNKINVSSLRNFDMFDRGQDVFNYKNKKIGIVYTSSKKIDKRIKEIEKRGSLYRDDALLVTEIYLTKIIWDPLKYFNKRKKILQKYIKKLKIVVINLLWPWLKSFGEKGWPRGGGLDEALKRKNPIWINKLIQLHLDWYLYCLYNLNDEYWTDFYTKWAFKKIKTFKYKPRNCLKNLEEISLLGCKEKELYKKVKLLKQLIKDLTPLIHKKYNL